MPPSSDVKEIIKFSQMADRLAELHRGKQFHKFQMDVFKAIFEQGKKRIFIRKGRKGGGTETILYPVCRIAGCFPNRAAYIIGPTQKAQSEIIWDNRRLQNYLPREWKYKSNETDKRIRLPNGSFIKVEGADDPEAARGWEGDIFVWDEYKDHNPLALENCYPNVAPRDAVWIVLGTPPTQMSHHYFIKEQEIKNDPDWAFFHWSAWDNPFLPGGHEWLKKEKEKYYARGDGDLWEIEWEAKYVFRSKRRVLPNFRRDHHVVPYNVIDAELARDKQNMRWICSIDPGYATCFAVLFVAYNPYTSQLYVMDEIYSTDKNQNSVIDMWPRIEEKQKMYYDGKWTNIYDSAALGFATEVRAYLRDRGRSVPLIPTVKDRNDEDDYFRAINASYSVVGRVKIAKHCVGFIGETENYETDDKDRYPDKNNHQLDNQRYIYKFLGYTINLAQSKITVVSKLPRGYTPEQDFKRQDADKDFVGYGGFDAPFDPTKLFGDL